MASGEIDTGRNAPSEVAAQDQEGLKAIATRSRNSRAQDNVELEQIKAGGEPAEYEEGKAGWHPAQWTQKERAGWHPAEKTRKKKLPARGE